MYIFKNRRTVQAENILSTPTISVYLVEEMFFQKPVPWSDKINKKQKLNELKKTEKLLIIQHLQK